MQDSRGPKRLECSCSPTGDPTATSPLTAEASCKDEARIGNKGRVCHRWWLKGERAPGLVQQGYQWAYIFSAICQRRRECASASRSKNASLTTELRDARFQGVTAYCASSSIDKSLLSRSDLVPLRGRLEASRIFRSDAGVACSV